MPGRHLVISSVLVVVAIGLAMLSLREGPPSKDPARSQGSVLTSRHPAVSPRHTGSDGADRSRVTQEFRISWFDEASAQPLALQVRSLDGELIEEHSEIHDHLEISLLSALYDLSFSAGHWERHRGQYSFDAPRTNEIEIGRAVGLVDVEIRGPDFIGQPVTLTWGDDPASTVDARVGDRIQLESRWGYRALDLQREFGDRQQVRKTATVLPSGADPIVFDLYPPRRLRVRFEPPLDDGCTFRLQLRFEKPWDPGIAGGSKKSRTISLSCPAQTEAVDVEPGHYRLRATSFSSHCVIDPPSEVFVDPTRPVTEIVIPQSRSGLAISGIVVDESGRPAPGAALFAHVDEPRDHVRYRIQSDADGRFELHNALQRPHRLAPLSQGSATVHVDGPTRGVVITLPNLEKTRVTLTDIPVEIETVRCDALVPQGGFDGEFAPDSSRSVRFSLPLLNGERAPHFLQFTLRDGTTLYGRYVNYHDNKGERELRVKYEELGRLHAHPKRPSPSDRRLCTPASQPESESARAGRAIDSGSRALAVH